jgi:hypothetical protein
MQPLNEVPLLLFLPRSLRSDGIVSVFAGLSGLFLKRRVSKPPNNSFCYSYNLSTSL